MRGTRASGRSSDLLQVSEGVGSLLVGASPLTDSVGGQAAADPDHRTAHGATNASLRLGVSDEPSPTRCRAIFAPALPIDFNVVGMDQHLRITSFRSYLLCSRVSRCLR